MGRRNASYTRSAAGFGGGEIDVRLLRYALGWALCCILSTPAAAQRPLQLVLSAGDGTSLAGYVVEADGDGWSGVFDISPAGRVILPGAAAVAGRETRLQVLKAGVGPRFHPVRFSLQATDTAFHHGVVLIPEVWTVRRGRFAGQAVEVDLVGAFEPGCWSCSSFFRRVGDPVPGYARSQIATWPQSALPIRVAFERGRVLQGRVTARDSVAFWAGAHELEAVLGRHLFRPVTYPEILPEGADDFADDIILVSTEPSLAEHGLGSAVSQRGDIFFGAVRLRNSALLHAPDGQRLLIHELLHALGLGHTCSWRSMMADARCPGRRASHVTAEDAAHLELLLAVRELQRRTGAVFGLEASLAGVLGEAGGAGYRTMRSLDRNKVVPAKAGTRSRYAAPTRGQIPQCSSLGPRFRGDDDLCLLLHNTTSPPPASQAGR